ncbi:unnamed protein product, partial [Staurois parvus]
RAGRSAVVSCRALPVPRSSAAQSSRAGFCDSRVPTGHALRFVNGHRSLCLLCQSLVISCTVSAVSGHLLYCVCSL